MTPLIGADGQVYAIAQGSLVVGGFGVSGKDGSRIAVNVPSAGPRAEWRDRRARSAEWFHHRALRHAQPAHAGLHHRRRGSPRASTSCWATGTAQSVDGVSVKVAAPADASQRTAYLSTLETIEIEPGDAPARVIVNSRTGTVVIGSHVRVMPAAVSHGSLVRDHHRARLGEPAQ